MLPFDQHCLFSFVPIKGFFLSFQILDQGMRGINLSFGYHLASGNVFLRQGDRCHGVSI